MIGVDFSGVDVFIEIALDPESSFIGLELVPLFVRVMGIQGLLEAATTSECFFIAT